MNEKKLDEKKLESVTGGMLAYEEEALLEQCRLLCEGCPAAHKSCPLNDDIELIKTQIAPVGHCYYRDSFDTAGG